MKCKAELTLSLSALCIYPRPLLLFIYLCFAYPLRHLLCKVETDHHATSVRIDKLYKYSLSLRISGLCKSFLQVQVRSKVQGTVMSL